MKNLELRSSLIKSGLLLGLVIFFIYAFAVGDSGGVGGTISSLFAAITFLIGLCIAVALSVIIMFGIYFGILYLYNPAVSAKTFAEFKNSVSDVSEQLCSCDSCGTSNVTVPAISADDLQPLQTSQDKLAGQLASIGSSVETMQKTLTGLNASITATQESIDALGEKTASIEDELEKKATADAIDSAAKKLAVDITAVKNTVQPLNDKITSIEESIAAGDDSSNDETTEAIAALKKELAALKKKLAEKAAQAEKTVASEDKTSEESEHRILSYFSKKADEKKFIALVKESVEKEMTYAQIDEFLAKSLSKDASAVTTDHPSLTKDFIRDCRQKS